MFKSFSRSLRETVERRLCFFKPEKLTQEHVRNPSSVPQASVLPTCAFYCSNRRNRNVLDQNRENLGCGGKRKERERRGRNWRDSINLEYTGLGFIGWKCWLPSTGGPHVQPAHGLYNLIPDKFEELSPVLNGDTELQLQGTALVMGWYMGQPMYQRRILPSDITFTEIVSAQPPCPCNVNNVIDVKGENATSKTQPYGPLTAQEAFDRAANNLMEVQKKVVGDIDNRLGVQLLRNGRLNEGLAHLCRAVELGHAAAAFNLAICYEKGIGIPRDLRKAAKYYEVAAARRHPAATFNLGVFYAHGWGGLHQDTGRAKELVLAASATPSSHQSIIDTARRLCN